MAINSIFVNLPVADLPAATAFYTALGGVVDPNFTNDDAASIVITEHLSVMLLTKPFFSTFTSKDIIDAKRQVQVLNAVSADSRDEVDALLALGLAAGGAEPTPAQDHGFMYTRDLEDLDGHIWEVFWIDPQAAAGGPGA